ncbi:unnamed protein product [Arctogadus glacialis]
MSAVLRSSSESLCGRIKVPPLTVKCLPPSPNDLRPETGPNGGHTAAPPPAGRPRCPPAPRCCARGVIKTALPNMDREVKEQYQVLIQAKDMGGQLGGLAGTTTVNISLSDVNDNPPRFSKSFFHLRVPESSAVGSAVGRIKAHDLDVGKNAEVEYNIVPGDGGAMFDITTNEHNQEGIIVLRKPLDYESKKAYTFKVDATNAHPDPRFQSYGAFKDTATVKINVLDVDEPPVFNKPAYLMDVYEDTPAGTIIGAVTAQDLDAGNSPVRYSIDWKSDLDSYFDIDPVEGTISTNELLDRENVAQHNISIVATKLTVNTETLRPRHEPKPYDPDTNLHPTTPIRTYTLQLHPNLHHLLTIQNRQPVNPSQTSTLQPPC